MPTTRIERANAIRFLSMDAVEKAKSGHPGAPMGMADMAEVLWMDFMRHNPANPRWINRDRFVLSNGHATMLLYSVLHLTGYDLPVEELMRFRQFDSRTPGHPEEDVTPGVDATTGPLGQGVSMAVGMAIAERMLAATFNRDGFPVVDHHTYVFLGEGCLMEGIASEACALAGTLGLGKLVVLFDQNGISIDGDVRGWFAEDVAARYRSYGWHVIENVDGHDGAAIKRALAKARKVTDKPSLVCCRTVIAHGAPTKAGSEKTHGNPLGAEEIAAARKALGWPHPPFVVPDAIRKSWNARRKGKAAENAWNALFAEYAKKYPDLAKEFTRRMKGELPEGLAGTLDSLARAAQKAGEKTATRIASRNVLNALMPGGLPELLGGAADLSPSVNTLWEGAQAINGGNFAGNYIRYGVREFAMGAIMNGLALHGGFIPYAGTFLTFSDYARSAMRHSALMRKRVIWVLSHDSIGVGEDGPTHQPVEQIPSMRLIPNLELWRPADAAETVVAWKCALERTDGPTVLALSRQDLAPVARDADRFAAIERGGYVLYDCAGQPDAIIITAGSETAISLEAAKVLEEKGRKIRVVIMPCVERFESQDQAWRDAVLPPAVRARVAVEASHVDGWCKYVGLDGAVVGMRGYGKAAPGAELFKHFGFTTENVVGTVEAVLKK